MQVIAVDNSVFGFYKALSVYKNPADIRHNWIPMLKARVLHIRRLTKDDTIILQITGKI